jgi:hypothetical protein
LDAGLLEWGYKESRGELEMAEIREDSLVRYMGTGTIGTVKVLKTEDDGTVWAYLDSTGLYYRQDMMDAAKMQDENLETGG